MWENVVIFLEMNWKYKFGIFLARKSKPKELEEEKSPKL